MWLCGIPIRQPPLVSLDSGSQISKRCSKRSLLILKHTKVQSFTLLHSKTRQDMMISPNIKTNDVVDGVPEGHVLSSNPIEAVELFIKASPENFKRGIRKQRKIFLYCIELEESTMYKYNLYTKQSWKLTP